MIKYFSIQDENYYFEVVGAEPSEVTVVSSSNYPLLCSKGTIYKINDGEKVFVKAMPKKLKLLSFTFELTENGGELISKNPAVSVLKNECIYIVYIKNDDELFAVKRDILRMNNDTIITTIFNNRVSNINIATSNLNSTFPLEGLCECDIVSTVIRGAAYIIVTAELSDKKQLTLFSVSNKIKVILSAKADDFLWSNEYLIKCDNLVDMQGRIKRSYFRLTSSKVEFAKNEFSYVKPCDYSELLKTYDFTDAIIAEDYEYAKKMVSEELKEQLADLHCFIGEIIDVITPTKLDETHQLRIIVSGKELTIKKLCFEMKYGLINNVEIE